MNTFTEVTVHEAKKIIETDAPVIIDVRDAQSYQEQHIEGAMLNHDSLIEHILSTKAKDTPVMVYCFKGISSRNLADTLGKSGFEKVYSIQGGFTEWKKHY